VLADPSLVPGADLVARTLNEVARVGWSSDGLPADCYLLTEPALAERLPGVAAVDGEAGPGLVWVRDDRCTALAAHAEVTCKAGRRLDARSTWRSDLPGEIGACVLNTGEI
jgi:hypothetical protein